MERWLRNSGLLKSMRAAVGARVNSRLGLWSVNRPGIVHPPASAGRGRAAASAANNRAGVLSGTTRRGHHLFRILSEGAHRAEPGLSARGQDLFHRSESRGMRRVGAQHAAPLPKRWLPAVRPWQGGEKPPKSPHFAREPPLRLIGRPEGRPRPGRVLKDAGALPSFRTAPAAEAGLEPVRSPVATPQRRF